MLELDAEQTLTVTRAHETTAANTFRITDHPPVFVRGEGPWLYTASGERYLDLVCGSATTVLGHGHPAHRQAIEAVSSQGLLHTGTRLPSPWRARLYQRLSEILPARLDTFQLANSGAEAIEVALKAAQFATGRRRFVAFSGGYHGRTLGALSLTHSARLRDPFSTLDELVDFVPYPFPDDPIGPVHDVTACLDALRAVLDRHESDADLPAAIVIEAVQGVGGVIAPPPAFLRGVRDIAGRFGVLLLADEIWTGMGRTGRMFAFEHSGVVPDLVALGKSLSGALPLSAVAAPAAILKAWPSGMHTSTFQGNPLSCALACATLDVLHDERLLDHVAKVVEPTLAEALGPLSKSSGVSAVRIVGAQAGVDLITEDGVPDARRMVEMQRAALARGVLVYGGGWHGNTLMLVAPANIGRTELTQGAGVVAELLSD